MAVSLTHATVAVGTDAGNGEIRKLQWNEEHALTAAANKLLGTVSAGAVGEIDCTSAGRALLDDADAAAQRTTLELGTANSPHFTGIELGHASDTTLTRASAGVVAVEGVNLVRAGDVTSSGLTQATARILGRTTASAGAIEEISAGPGLNLASGSLVLNGPAFSARRAADQTGIASATYTKVQLTTEDFDTNSNFDSATNYRFTPTVAGYYLFTAFLSLTGTGLADGNLTIQKNADEYYYGSKVSNAAGSVHCVVSVVLAMNGSTDYVELYARATVSGGTITAVGGADGTRMTGCFLRGL